MPRKLEKSQKLTHVATSATTRLVMPQLEALDAQRAAADLPPLGAGPLLQALVDGTKVRQVGYEATEAALQVQLADQKEAREELDGATDEMRALLVDGKAGIERAWDGEFAVKLNLSGATPLNDTGLASRAQGFLTAVGRLESVPETKDPFITMDLAKLQSRVEAALPRLKAAMEAYGEEGRDVQQARLERDMAQSEWRKEAVLLSAMARAVLIHLGQEEQARTVVPTTRQIERQEDVEVVEVTEEAPEA